MDEEEGVDARRDEGDAGGRDERVAGERVNLEKTTQRR